MWLVRAGFTGIDDSLPARLTSPNEAIPDGPTEGQYNRLDEMLPEYYELRGWSPEGIPTPETLEALGIPATPDAS